MATVVWATWCEACGTEVDVGPITHIIETHDGTSNFTLSMDVALHVGYLATHNDEKDT